MVTKRGNPIQCGTSCGGQALPELVVGIANAVGLLQCGQHVAMSIRRPDTSRFGPPCWRTGLPVEITDGSAAISHPIASEALSHFQALLALDTTNPPGNEILKRHSQNFCNVTPKSE